MNANARESMMDHQTLFPFALIRVNSRLTSRAV